MSPKRMNPFSNQGKRYAIIGNSAAGIAAAKEIRRYDPRGQITIISDEPSFGYSRVLLPLYIAGKIRKRKMLIAPEDFYSSLRIRLLRNDPVEAIDPRAQRVYTRRGKNLPYDSLLVATGSSPRTLGVPDENLQGIHYLRKISDAEAIKKDLSSSRGSVLLVGGGLVSVKSLEALVSKKREVHMVISSDRVLSQMLDKAASDLFLDSFRKKGVSVHLLTDVKGFWGKDQLEGAFLSDGTALSCSLAIIGKGVGPNVDLLKGTGVNLNQGISVDQHMATNLPCIYAAGDVAEPLDLLQGKNRGNAIWPLAVEGGRVAGLNMALASTEFSGGLRMNVVEALGIRVVSAGNLEGDQQAQYFQKESSVYRKVVFSKGHLTGFLLAGDIQGAGILTSLIKNATQLSPSILEEGLRRGFSFRPRLQALGGAIESREPKNL